MSTPYRNGMQTLPIYKDVEADTELRGRADKDKDKNLRAQSVNTARHVTAERSQGLGEGERAETSGLTNSRLLTRQEKWQRKNPEKRRAHEAVRDALRRGLLVKQPCEVCGSVDHLDAHHERYDRPLDVVWLCRLHHMRRHPRKRIFKGGK